MDPNAAVTELNRSLALAEQYSQQGDSVNMAQALEDVAQHATDLAEWIRKSGFMPMVKIATE